MKTVATLVLATALPLLAACGRDAPPADHAVQAPGEEPGTFLGRTVARAMDEARKELREGDLSLNGEFDARINGKRVHRGGADNLPPAAITPQGELVVAGTKVPMDEAGHALALAYREALIAVAETGMDLGVHGADLGMRAARDAIGSLFRGDTEAMEARVEAEARKLEAAAMQLCDQLPHLLDTQQALAAAVPEFAPYARLTAGDVKDCREHHDDPVDPGSAVADAADATHGRPGDRFDAAAEADAAAETGAAAPEPTDR